MHLSFLTLRCFRVLFVAALLLYPYSFCLLALSTEPQLESESFTWSGQRQEHSSSKVYLTLWWPQVSCKFWESRSGTAEERPDAESTALDGAEAAKSATSATSAKHLDIFSHDFTCLKETVFYVYVFVLNLVEHSLQCLSTGFSSTCGPRGVSACWSLNVWCFVFVCFFPSLSHVLARDLVAVWVWNLDRWLSLQILGV